MAFHEGEDRRRPTFCVDIAGQLTSLNPIAYRLFEIGGDLLECRCDLSRMTGFRVDSSKAKLP